MAVRFQGVVVVLLLSLSCFATRADESKGIGLASALKEHYKLATSKLGTDGDLRFVPGTILTVRKEGIMSFENADFSFATLCPSKIRGGSVQAPRDVACTSFAPKNRRTFKIAESVCVTAIDVNTRLDQLSMLLATCDPYNTSAKSKTDRAMVLFVFPKGMLGKATAARIEEVIGETLSESRGGVADQQASGAAAGKENTVAEDKKEMPPVEPVLGNAAPADEGKTSGGGAEAGSQAGSQPAAGGPASPSGAGQPCKTAPEDAPAKAPEVTKGMTMDQVTAILGQPSKIADLHSKMIYFYPDLRVFFVGGKVSEVHRIGSQE
jgi:hypothetical protein